LTRHTFPLRFVFIFFSLFWCIRKDGSLLHCTWRWSVKYVYFNVSSMPCLCEIRYIVSNISK
jgi:hypothetical protein